MKKKLFALFLALALCLPALAGCGSKPAAEPEFDNAVQAIDEAIGNDGTMIAVDEDYVKGSMKMDVSGFEAWTVKINAYGEKKDSAAWQRTLVEASQRTGRSSYLQNLMYYYMQNNKIQEATELATQLVAEHPEDKMAWFMKGAIELNIKKEYEAARGSFEKALAIDPDFEDALFNMGTCYINDIYDQRMSGKFKYIGTDRRVEGRGEAAYNKEKAIYEKELATVKSYYEKAKPYLEHLRELTPDDAKRWASPLQMVYSTLNMTEQAKEMDALLEAANNR